MLDAFTARIEQLRAGRQSFCHALQDRFVDIAQDPTEGAFRTLRLELALLARGAIGVTGEDEIAALALAV